MLSSWQLTVGLFTTQALVAWKRNPFMKGPQPAERQHSCCTRVDCSVSKWLTGTLTENVFQMTIQVMIVPMPSLVMFCHIAAALSQSQTICSLTFLKKDERACMQSCHGRLGSNLVWGMSKDQTLCLEVGQPVCKLDILSHWLSWQNMRESLQSCHGLLGSEFVWSMTQHQTICLKVEQHVSKWDDLAQLIFDKRLNSWNKLTCTLAFSRSWTCIHYTRVW